jgi:hypothetical protein
MSLHGPRTQIPSGPATNWRLSTVLAVLACLGAATTADAASQSRDCSREVSAASVGDDVPDSIRTRVARSVGQASALSRFDRSGEALARLDALIAFVEGRRGERVEDDARTKLTDSIRALKRCVAALPSPPLTWITIAVFDEANTPEGDRGEPAAAGVFLDAEGIPIGRTGTDGTLGVNLPSGTVELHAIEYPSSGGEKRVTVSAGESRTISIVMAGDKEPGEESDLVLEEAPDDILSANPGSLTLQFKQDDQPVWIEHIDSIELSDVRDSAGENLKQFFSVSGGVMRATDVPAVSRMLAQQSMDGRLLRIMVSGIDAEGRTRYGDVQFQIGNFKVTVTLAAPPSNPALPVSNISVRVSVGGGEAAMKRVSDASGRFEIDSLPDATIHIDAHTAASGTHYYADATITLCGDTSATVLLRNVKDIVAGVRGAVMDSVAATCPPSPRR